MYLKAWTRMFGGKKNDQLKTQAVITSIVALLYALFWRWYTGSQKPLTSAEVEEYTKKLIAMGGDPAVVDQIRAFLQSDTGKSFVMINLIKLRDQPQFAIQDRAVSGTSEDTLKRYTSRFLPEILKHAGHPVLQGNAASNAVEVWGIPGGEDWTIIGLVRYRSRRDMIEAATASNFSDIHGYKIAAIEKTIAVPADPWFHIGDPRLIAGLMALLGVTWARYFIRRERA